MVENFVTRLTRIVSHGTNANVLRHLATTNEVCMAIESLGKA